VLSFKIINQTTMSETNKVKICPCGESKYKVSRVVVSKVKSVFVNDTQDTEKRWYKVPITSDKDVKPTTLTGILTPSGQSFLKSAPYEKGFMYANYDGTTTIVKIEDK